MKTEWDTSHIFFTLVTLFQYTPHYFVVFQMQDEPYIKAIINHIHLVQTWLLSELKMSSSLCLSFFWGEVNIYFKHWENLRAYIMQFLQIKKMNDYCFRNIAVTYPDCQYLVSAKWQNSYSNWINGYVRLRSAEISTQLLRLLDVTHFLLH